MKKKHGVRKTPNNKRFNDISACYVSEYLSETLIHPAQEQNQHPSHNMNIWSKILEKKGQILWNNKQMLTESQLLCRNQAQITNESLTAEQITKPVLRTNPSTHSNQNLFLLISQQLHSQVQNNTKIQMELSCSCTLLYCWRNYPLPFAKESSCSYLLVCGLGFILALWHQATCWHHQGACLSSGKQWR